VNARFHPLIQRRAVFFGDTGLKDFLANQITRSLGEKYDPTLALIKYILIPTQENQQFIRTELIFLPPATKNNESFWKEFAAWNTDHLLIMLDASKAENDDSIKAQYQELANKICKNAQITFLVFNKDKDNQINKRIRDFNITTTRQDNQIEFLVQQNQIESLVSDGKINTNNSMNQNHKSLEKLKTTLAESVILKIKPEQQNNIETDQNTKVLIDNAKSQLDTQIILIVEKITALLEKRSKKNDISLQDKINALLIVTANLQHELNFLTSTYLDDSITYYANHKITLLFENQLITEQDLTVFDNQLSLLQKPKSIDLLASNVCGKQWSTLILINKSVINSAFDAAKLQPKFTRWKQSIIKEMHQATENNAEAVKLNLLEELNMYIDRINPNNTANVDVNQLAKKFTWFPTDQAKNQKANYKLALTIKEKLENSSDSDSTIKEIVDNDFIKKIRKDNGATHGILGYGKLGIHSDTMNKVLKIAENYANASKKRK
jgi:hypothetical protein